MADFWAEIFEKLYDNEEIMELITADTDSQDLLSWTLPNPKLAAMTAPFMKKRKIIRRAEFEKLFLNYLKQDRALRKLLFLTWKEKNAKLMNFFTFEGNENLKQRLIKGEFGDIRKVKILSIIEPRSTMKAFFAQALETMQKAQAEKAITEKVAVQHSEGSDETNSAVLSNLVTKLEENLKAAREDLAKVKKELANTREELATLKKSLQEVHEINLPNLNKAIELKSQENKEALETITSLTTENKNLQAKLDYELKNSEKLQKDLAAIPDTGLLSSKLDKITEENETLLGKLSEQELIIQRLSKQNKELQLLQPKEIKQAVIVERQTEESEKPPLLYFAGRLAAKIANNPKITGITGKNTWLFITLNEQPIFISAEFVSSYNVIPEETLLLATDKEHNPIFLTQLEDSEEILGYVIEKDEELYLETPEMPPYPIFTDLSKEHIDKPAKGYFLPESFGRPAGIYKIELLPEQRKKHIVHPTQKPASQKESEETADAPAILFNGEKVMIIGGDYVGSNYIDRLAELGLQTTWKSGFERIKELPADLDLIIVIVRQMSHTVLREISTVTKKMETPVLYSGKRGVSSILKEIETFFSKKMP
ncbi:MAG: DUF2325 domain-containing protein [Candidatus Riflebacteria bacterium]|nr:DUF2325 domain-containing protein [Candidatus Riflebacteria bacterium]